MSMRPQIPVRSSESEQALQFIRQMGIENVSLMLGPDELTAEAIRAQKNKLAAFGLDGLVQKIAKLTKANSLREWKRVCKDTLGIDLMDDYYNGDFYEEFDRRLAEARRMIGVA